MASGGWRGLVPVLVPEHGLTVAVSALCWLLCFLVSRKVSAVLSMSYRRLPAGEKVDWDSRVVSNLHALYGVAAGVYIMRLPLWAKSIVSGGTRDTDLLLCVSLGYFVYDLVLCLLNEAIRSKSTLTHHTLALVCFGSAVLCHVCQYFLAIFLITESTTPFVNLRVFLDKMGMKRSLWYVANGLAMWAGFLFVRIIYTNWAVRSALVSHEREVATYQMYLRVAFYALLGIITVLNSYWFYRITLGIVRALRAALGAKSPASGSRASAGVGSASPGAGGAQKTAKLA